MMLKWLLQNTHSSLSVNQRNFAKYLRNKPHLNLGVIGHQAHGKSTLTSAISKYLSKKGLSEFHSIRDLAKSPDERSKGYTINTATIEFETDKLHVCYTDCPGHTSYTKNTIIGASRMDTAILVVGEKGPEKQTREHILIAKHVGVNNIILYLNKADLIKDPTELEIIELEARDFLTKYGYDGSKTPVIKGSALSVLEDKNPELGENSIKALIDAIETVGVPKRDTAKPFYMQIDHSMPPTVFF